MNKETITALVPIRANSQRVKDKGIRPFVDSTLLEVKISSLLKTKVDSIVVTSDCEKILQIARACGVKTHKREEYYASSECSGSEFFENLASTLEGENFLYSPPTAPFIKPSTIDRAIDTFFCMKENKDSLASVFPLKHHMWLDNTPLNYKLEQSPNSQDLPDIFKITYGINLISKKNMIKYSNVVGKNPEFLVLEEVEAVDVDTMVDFWFAEFLYRKMNNV